MITTPGVMTSILVSLTSLFVWLVLASILLRVALMVIRRILRRREYRESLQPAGDPTRFALASLWLSGGRFRRRVLDLDRELCRARAPETGIDVELVVAACRRIDSVCTRRNALILVLMILALPVFMTGGGGFALLLLSGRFPFLVLVATMSFLILCGFTLWSIWRDDFVNAREFSREEYEREAAREKYIQPGGEVVEAFPTTGNVLCFGSTDPFVGFGTPVGAWQIASTLVPGAERDPVPLSTEILHEAIARSVQSSGLKNLAAKDYLFLNGTELAQIAKQDNLKKAFLPEPLDRPRTIVPSQAIRYFRVAADDRIRPYACFSIANWGAEVVTNCFVRAIVEGNSVSVEMVTTVLLPVDRAYRKVDELSRPGKLGTILWFARVLSRVPLYWIDAVYSIMVFAKQWIKDMLKLDQFRIHREIRLNPAFNYGATETIREMISCDEPHFYFQRADIRRAREVLTKSVLEAVIETLRKSGYSTRDFEVQGPMLVNNSISINAGGELNISGAVGRGHNVLHQTAVNMAATRR